MFRSPREARQAGISTVYQELTVLPNLSVAENVFLGREPRTRLGSRGPFAGSRLRRAHYSSATASRLIRRQ